MIKCFVDTSCYVAYLNAKDQDHEAAVACLSRSDLRLVTTDWVLVEVANFFSESRHRAAAAALIRLTIRSTDTRVVRITPSLFTAALDLYSSRLDKHWSLTDAASFVVMRDRKLIHALTSDHHFRQAGFQTVLRSGFPD